MTTIVTKREQRTRMSEEATQAPQAEGNGQESTEATTVDESTGETLSETTYANGKFKSVSDMESSYLELQTTFSKKLGAFEGAPEVYEYNEGVEANSTLEEWGRENQLSNDGLNSLAQKMHEVEQAKQEEYVKSEMAALGKDAEIRVKNATDWVRANLGEAFVDDVNGMWAGARGIEAVEKMMKVSQGTTVAPTQAEQFASDAKLQEMRFAKDEFGNRKMNDPKYRQQVMEMEARARGESSFNGYRVES